MRIGSQQEVWKHEIEQYGCCEHPSHARTGKTKKYGDRYLRSFRSLIGKCFPDCRVVWVAGNSAVGPGRMFVVPRGTTPSTFYQIVCRWFRLDP